MWETWIWSLGWEEPLKEGMETHSSIPAWRIPIDMKSVRNHWEAYMCASRLMSRKWLYRSGMYSWNSRLISFMHICSCLTLTQEAHKSANNRSKMSYICVFIKTEKVLRRTLIIWYETGTGLSFSVHKAALKRNPHLVTSIWKDSFSKLWNVWQSLFHFC